MYLLSNTSDFNTLIATTLKNINATKGKGKDYIGRRELEQAIAPAVSGGKSHAALAAELGALVRSFQSKQEINTSDFNTLIATTLKNINATKGKGKDYIDRRELEQAIAPAVSGGKSHAALAAELKLQPKTANGALVRSFQSKQEIKSFADKIAGVAKSITLFNNYKSDSEYLLTNLKECLATNEQLNTYKKTLPPEFGAICEVFLSLEDSISSNTVSNVAIKGADVEATHVMDEKKYQSVISLEYGKNSLSFNLDWRSCDLGTRVLDLYDTFINGKHIDEWVDDAFTNPLPSTGRMLETILIGISEVLIHRGLNDISKEGATISPELLMLLNKELS